MTRFTHDKKMLEYDLNQSYPNIFCFSTTRHGGHSKGTYSSFNCNPYCGDNPENVAQNQKLLSSLLAVPPQHLIIPHQTHETHIRIIDKNFSTYSISQQTRLLEHVDALISNIPGECLCISTADCVPILCYDTQRHAIAAIHAGWRGTVQRIAQKTVEAMNQTYGTDPKDLVVCIGPSISLKAFEVGEEVYEAFLQAGFPMSQIASRSQKWHLDLWEANRIQLLEAGVPPKNIELSGICTFQQHEDFFSARRQGLYSGRILSGIILL